MHIFKKKENQFLILVLLSFIFHIVDPILFWKITGTPYVKAGAIGQEPGGKFVFFDLRYLQYLSGYFDSIFLPSDELYNLYKQKGGMVINYPRIWIVISYFTNIKSDIVLYTLYLLIFLSYTNIFFKLTKQTNSYFFCYLFFCGANFLLLERGNVDIILITLIFYSYFSNSKIINYIGYIIASFLKIYPAFSLLFFLNNKKSLIKILMLSSIFIIYLFFIKDDLRNISLVNPKNGYASYGFLSIIFNIKEHFNININYALFVCANLTAVILIYFFVVKKKIELLNFEYSNIFLLGGGIYIFTYLINTHHDYRLMYLIFCVPMVMNINNSFYKSIYLINLFFSLELQRMLLFFGFWGVALNNLSKLILFYLTFILYFDIVSKKMIKFIKIK